MARDPELLSGDLAQRIEDKRPFCQTWMWDGKPRCADDPVPKQQQVQIEGPRTPPFATPNPSVPLLDVLQLVQQPLRSQPGKQPSRRIDEVRLVRGPHGRAAVEAGTDKTLAGGE
jgi:hypothetical protein